MGSADPLTVLQESLRGAPIIWKGEYPYFIHPISDGIPRMDPDVLRATRDLIVSSVCLLYTSPSPRDAHESRMPSSA